MQIALNSFQTLTLKSTSIKALAQTAGNSPSPLSPLKSDQFLRFGRRDEDAEEDKYDEPLKPDLDPVLDDPNVPYQRGERLDDETRKMVARSEGNGVYYPPNQEEGFSAPGGTGTHRPDNSSGDYGLDTTLL